MKGWDTKLKLIQTTKASINAGNLGKVAENHLLVLKALR